MKNLKCKYIRGSIIGASIFFSVASVSASNPLLFEPEHMENWRGHQRNQRWSLQEYYDANQELRKHAAENLKPDGLVKRDSQGIPEYEEDPRRCS